MLSLKQIENICLVNDVTGKKCKYLTVNSLNDQNYYICLKLSETNKKIIDEQVKLYNDFYKNSKLVKLPPLGDNCSGYKISLYIEQGYDVKE
jgi:hypothetical protein